MMPIKSPSVLQTGNQFVKVVTGLLIHTEIPFLHAIPTSCKIPEKQKRNVIVFVIN